MVALTDLAPSTRTVRVGGADVSVFGVSAKGIAALLTSFPTLKTAFAGGKIKVDAETVMTVAPDAIASIIAAGCGFPGDAAATAVAEKLSVGDQLTTLQAIAELTMPDGLGPFVETLNKLMALMDEEDARGKVSDSKSASPSNG